MSDIVLHSPFAGWLTPLEEVPDPVFAERMMGDGVAIDPTENVLRSPADGTVIAIPDSAHAVTLRLANGAELLIHIGLETVALGGRGFRALSSAGAEVKAGDELIELDLAEVARGARSLVTPVILASEGFALSLESVSRRVRSGDPIGMVRGTIEASSASALGERYERSVRVDAAHGLHARPAARIAALVRRLGAEVSIASAERTANASSTIALMSLGIRQGDEVRIAGVGPQGKAATDAVAELIENGLGEAQHAPPQLQQRGPGPSCASPGIAVGTIVQLRASDLPVPQDGTGIAEEGERLSKALELASSSLTGEAGVISELAAAHRELLSDPDLRARANSEIAQGRSAAFAWRSACQAAREAIRATGDSLLIERAADLLDLERRVITVLAGGTEAAAVQLPEDAIIVAPDLLPSQFLALDKKLIAGICTAEGGPTSHVAILAASAGIPMLVAAGKAVLDFADGTTAILDGDHCAIEADPSAGRLEQARALLAEQSQRRSAQIREAHELAFTADGVRIEVFANLASVADAETAVAAGAEGCGLLRTEFLFLGRDAPPDEEEQREVYSKIAAALGERPLIVRTIDIGADKKVPYLGIANEENPALGLRGVRLSLARPDLFQEQLRAILRAVPAGQCRIMLPMVADLKELREARTALDAARTALGTPDKVPLGIMVETPASAMLADELAAEADFLSVGTNDLTQYALAADRTNTALGSMLDAFHPAVLRLIRSAAQGAKAHDRWIGVCGGLASDPLAAPLLIGLGVTELSVAPAAVPAVKAVVRRLKMDQCRELARKACAAALAEDVRKLAKEALE